MRSSALLFAGSVTHLFLWTATAVAIPQQDLGICVLPSEESIGLNAPVLIGKAIVLTGDTLRFETGICVRLWGIDSPEFSVAGGRSSRVALDQLLRAREIYCADTGERTASYVVATCTLLPERRDIGAEILRQGHAFTSRGELRGVAANTYLAAEAEAYEFRRGLWADRPSVTADAFSILHSWQSSLAALLALVAAWWTVRAIRRQTNLPINIAYRDKLLNQKVALCTLREELRITMEGLQRLKEGADECHADLFLARSFMPFWIFFPRVFDLRETTITEVGVDFGAGGVEEFTAVRETLRKILRLNYSIKRDAVGYLPAQHIQKILKKISQACGVGRGQCERLDRKLDRLILDLDSKLQIAIKKTGGF